MSGANGHSNGNGNGTGRPTKLTLELTGQIAKDVEKGNYAETAAQAAGITPKTFRNWMEWGAAGTEPYATFFSVIACARARFDVSAVAKVLAGGKGAHGAAWLLERTRPKQYAQRVHVKVQDELERLLDIAQGLLSESDFSRLCEALASDGREAPTGEAEGPAEPSVH